MRLYIAFATIWCFELPLYQKIAGLSESSAIWRLRTWPGSSRRRPKWICSLPGNHMVLVSRAIARSQPRAHLCEASPWTQVELDPNAYRGVSADEGWPVYLYCLVGNLKPVLMAQLLHPGVFDKR